MKQDKTIREQKEELVTGILDIRLKLIAKFEKLRDYKTNKNAIMKEVEHASVLHSTIVSIDNLLKDYVEFK